MYRSVDVKSGRLMNTLLCMPTGARAHTQAMDLSRFDVDASHVCVCVCVGHNDEILDVSFNSTGSRLVTASADGTARVYNTMTGACVSILVGHEVIPTRT